MSQSRAACLPRYLSSDAGQQDGHRHVTLSTQFWVGSLEIEQLSGLGISNTNQMHTSLGARFVMIHIHCRCSPPILCICHPKTTYQLTWSVGNNKAVTSSTSSLTLQIHHVEQRHRTLVQQKRDNATGELCTGTVHIGTIQTDIPSANFLILLLPVSPV